MGLDSYIFKTTKKEAKEKMKRILNTKKKAMENAITKDGFTFLIGDAADYMDKQNPNIYWRKFNHITSWILHNIFKNPKGTILKDIGIIKKSDLIALRNECVKVLEHCKKSDGTIIMDENYCKSIFPYQARAFFGGIEYDEDFLEEIEIAKKDIDYLLFTSNKPDVTFIFYADY